MKHILLVLTVLISFYACKRPVNTTINNVIVNVEPMSIDTISADSMLVDFNIKLDKTITSSIKKSNKNKAEVFNSLDTLKLSDNPKLADHIDQIEHILINFVTYNVSLIPTDCNVESLTVSIENTSFTFTVENVNFFTSDVELEVSEKMIREVANYLREHKELVIISEGMTKHYPVIISLDLNLYSIFKIMEPKI